MIEDHSLTIDDEDEDYDDHMRHLLDNQGPDQEYSEKNSRGPQLGLILLSLMIIRKHSHITNFCHLILKNKSFTFCHNRTFVGKVVP